MALVKQLGESCGDVCDPYVGLYVCRIVCLSAWCEPTLYKNLVYLTSSFPLGRRLMEYHVVSLRLKSFVECLVVVAFLLTGMVEMIVPCCFKFLGP